MRCFIGKICEVSSDKSLVKVDYLGTTTKLIPYAQSANSFKRHFSPPRVGEQAIVFELANDGIKFAIGAIFCQRYKEPSGASQTKEIIEYEDGTRLSYDTANSTMEIINPKTLNLIIQNDVNITCKSANLTAQTTTVISPSVTIKGNTTIQGAISTSGEGGSSGSFEILGDVRIRGNLSTTGNISDSRGDLTGHSHHDSDGGTSNPR